MRVLVTGASGFLGHHVVRWMESRHDVVATWLSRPVTFRYAESLCADLRNSSACARLLSSLQPTHVIHAAAMALTSDCERDPEGAHASNVSATANLLQAAQMQPAPPFFLHVSTDLVFDGTVGNYSENDPPNPIMVYGRTKLAAEQLVRESAVPCAVVRSSLVFGPPGSGRKSFLDWMIDGIREGKGVLFADEYRTPVYVDDLCMFLETACIRAATGTWHCAGPERLSRYEFGLRVAEAFALPAANVRKGYLRDTPIAAPRPADVSLDISKARQYLGFRPLFPAGALEKAKSSAAYTT